jgi:hypothetical protein
LCPKCGKPIRRIHVETGSVFARCEEYLRSHRRPEEATRERCQAHVHILGTGHGLCLVVELTLAEYEYLVERPRDVLELYEYLGVVAARAFVRGRGDLR